MLFGILVGSVVIALAGAIVLINRRMKKDFAEMLAIAKGKAENQEVA